MPNLSYQRSRRREYEVMHRLEKAGWFCVRSAGSHTIADLLCVRKYIFEPLLFDVRFIQIKTSRKIKKANFKTIVEEIPFGLVNVDYYYFPSRKK